MSNYNEAIKIVDKIYNKTDFTKEELQPLIDYLNKSETTEKEHEALKLKHAKVTELLGLHQQIWKIQHQDELTISAYTYEDLIELINKKETLEKELGETK